MTTALHQPNAAPVVSASDQTVLLGQEVAASSLFSVSDADGDAITQYELWDSTPGNGYFTVDGNRQGVNAAIGVSAAQLASTQFVAGASIGADQVWVRANDGTTWSDWKSWNVASAPHVGNAAPVTSAADRTIAVGEAVPASALFTVTDADADPIASFELWDDVEGGGYWRVGGVQQAAGRTIAVAAADLASAEYVGGASGGSERVWARASDGMQPGAWQPFNITTALHIPNAAPVVSASDQTVVLSQALDASALFSVSDADGDAITRYELWDSTLGSGYFTVDGMAQGVNVAIPVTADQLASTQFVAGSSTGADQVWVRANDGTTWSDWKSWTMSSSPHLGNSVPVVTASNNGLLRNEALRADSLFSVTDADGDAITQYQFWDDVEGGGYWRLDGVQQAAVRNIDVSAAGLDRLAYVGGADAGTEQVWVRANDGISWGPWKNWLMSTEGGMLRGGAGPDTLNGDGITPILEGGGGADTLNAGPPNSLLSSGAGDDSLAGAEGNDLLAGGVGNDQIATGGGANVVAFTRGGGTDTVVSGDGASNTLSLGGIGYRDLSLSKNGADLVLNAAADDHVVLKDWYAGKDNVVNLQVILDAIAGFDADSADPLANRRVQSFDFRGIARAFDQALAESPGLTSWAIGDALTQHHLAASDDAAIGGDLAYWYAANGGFAGIGAQSAREVLGGAGFGAEAQALRPFSGLQEGFAKLG